MASYNQVLLMGNLTRDPEKKYTGGGSPVTNFSIAVSRKFTTQAGEKKEEVSFFDVEAWGKQAETCAQYLHKGSAVFIDGQLRQDRWETNDGQKRSKVRVRATRVQFLFRMTREDDNQSPPRDKVEGVF